MLNNLLWKLFTYYCLRKMYWKKFKQWVCCNTLGHNYIWINPFYKQCSRCNKYYKKGKA